METVRYQGTLDADMCCVGSGSDLLLKVVTTAKLKSEFRVGTM